MFRIFLLICLVSQSVYGLGVSPFIKIDTGVAINSVKISHSGSNVTVNPYLSKATDIANASPSAGISLGLSFPLGRAVFTGLAVGMQMFNAESNYGINFIGYNVAQSSNVKAYETYTNKSKSSQFVGLILGSTYGPYYQYYIMPTVNRTKFDLTIGLSGVETHNVDFSRTGFGVEIGSVGNVTNTTSVGLKYALSYYGGKTVLDPVRKVTNESYNSHSMGLTLIQSF